MKNIIITNIEDADVIAVVSALSGLNISFAVEHSGISAPRIQADAPTVESPPTWYDPNRPRHESDRSFRKMHNGKTTDDIVIDRLRQKRATAFELRDALVAAGFNKTTYSGVLKRMLDAGAITMSTRFADCYVLPRTPAPIAAEPAGPSIGSEA